ncbi:MAG: Gfo/Idh/MocA family oxidoreductase [Planctomycetes bacterium]|nr:Gfo/Idh/MocA family oxidoreductase [Planctomycetota bacterium]
MTRTVRFGIIGGGLMGREFVSAAARWIHLDDMDVQPEIVAVCDIDPSILRWFERMDPRPDLVTDYLELLGDNSIEAVYCAVPHHRHEEIYRAVLQHGKHLLGEKPFGIDLQQTGKSSKQRVPLLNLSYDAPQSSPSIRVVRKQPNG